MLFDYFNVRKLTKRSLLSFACHLHSNYGFFNRLFLLFVGVLITSGPLLPAERQRVVRDAC